jgi:hypothetical protein
MRSMVVSQFEIFGGLAIRWRTMVARLRFVCCSMMPVYSVYACLGPRTLRRAAKSSLASAGHIWVTADAKTDASSSISAARIAAANWHQLNF